MKYSLWFIFTIALFTGIVTGTLGNGFIALVNIMDWIKRGKISSVDQILTALAFSRLSLVWSVLICTLASTLVPHLFINSEMLIVAEVIWTVNNHFSIWLATCLSVFYFLKVANFSNSFFLYLKWRVKKVVLVTLVVSLVFLSLNIVFTLERIQLWIDSNEGNMFDSLRNLTQFSSDLLVTNSSHVFLPTNSMFMFIPFTVSLVAFLLLTFSLCKHLKKMQVSGKRPKDAGTMAHVKALKTGFSFLLVYTIYLIFIVVGISSFGLVEDAMIIMFDYSSGLAFPTSHSFVLILGNSKLRRATLSVLWWLRCQFKDTETLGP
ncbi:taste receptor type 2 member 123-like [Phodopus roborovskii]|uniref:taste receptor type 2 member 123-like n=1 Tax=Phodopus roborovskii TaxID=109678 RepID=UPI0021E38F75|nr:taste receptor type 2 member 123-like [Phodopus roborovskii]